MRINTAISPAQLNNSQSTTSPQNQQQNIPQETQASSGSEKTTVAPAAQTVNPSGQVQAGERSESVTRQSSESSSGTENSRLDVFG